MSTKSFEYNDKVYVWDYSGDSVSEIIGNAIVSDDKYTTIRSIIDDQMHTVETARVHAVGTGPIRDIPEEIAYPDFFDDQLF